MMRVERGKRAQVTVRLAELPHLSRAQLIVLWNERAGQPPPKAVSNSLLLRAAAYAAQEEHDGGLGRRELRVLLKHAQAASDQMRGPQRRSAGLDIVSSDTLSKPECRVGLAKKRRKTPEGASRTVLRPGTRLVRDWQGRSHTVEVRTDGFDWNGTLYRSLSAVALAITGARWSGNRFFRL